MAENTGEISVSTEAPKGEMAFKKGDYGLAEVISDIQPTNEKDLQTLQQVRQLLKLVPDVNSAPAIAAAIDAAKDSGIYNQVRDALGPQLSSGRLEEQSLLRTAASESKGWFKRVRNNVGRFFNNFRKPMASDTILIPEPDGISKFAAEALNTTNSQSFRQTARQTATEALNNRNEARLANKEYPVNESTDVTERKVA